MDLVQADALAELLHRDQVDKAGKPYIDHPRAVAESARQKGLPDHVVMVALLHDVVEDCDVNLGDLAGEQVPGAVLEAIDAISRRDDEKYADYIRRVAENPMAKQVKILDLQHNLSPSRQADLPEDEQRSLAKRYNRSLAYLVDGWDVL